MLRMCFAAMLMCLSAGAALAEPGLKAPEGRNLIVAFAVTDSANVMDIAGSWEVFQDTHVEARGSSMGMQMPFDLIVVSDRTTPVRATGGLSLVPQYTFDNAPKPDIVVVGAQAGAPGLVQWLKAQHDQGAVVMSVCTGAFKLAATGLLDGRQATTHHDYARDFASKFPQVKLVPGNRFVRSDERVFTAGGLTSGIDLSLHIVELYFGREAAARTANYMEYTGTGWMHPEGASPIASR